VATAEDVRRFALALPRAYEALVRDRVKYRVKQIVFLSLSRDETLLGFAFPKEERVALVESDPDRFLMPRESDLRYNWVVGRLERLSLDELQDIVEDAWRMVVPKGVAAAHLDDPLRRL
jgi:hypothetical protein